MSVVLSINIRQFWDLCLLIVQQYEGSMGSGKHVNKGWYGQESQ